METYTKINTLYKRYQNLRKKDIDLPNPDWKKFANMIILGHFADPTIEYLKSLPMEASEKIDGTNSKIAFFPSTGTYLVGGKTDKADSQHGQFEYLSELAEKILPKLKAMFPKECAVFRPTKDKATNKPMIYFPCEVYKENSEIPEIEWKPLGAQPPQNGMYGVEYEEQPIYIYGEYYGNGIQKVGPKYRNDNDFVVFDINKQGWWLPKELRDDLCHKLGLHQVPSLGHMTLLEAERVVRQGFKTHLEAVDPTLLAEGIVLRSPNGLKDSSNNRLIVKIKHCDYVAYDAIRKQFSDDEFKKFNEWYFKNIESE